MLDQCHRSGRKLVTRLEKWGRRISQTMHLEKENQSRDVEEKKLQLFGLIYRRRRVRRSMVRNL